LRAKWGHYLGATLYFEGEWYWGTDRLHYLEQRLQQAGLLLESVRGTPAPLIGPKTLHFVPANKPAGVRPVVHFYCSLRSPYTYLAAAQVRQLAQHYGADLKLRFVLPMVMRGLPVPLAKRLYILRDTKREALRLGMPFGAVVDPVGKPVEMGLAVLHAAIRKGQGPAFLEAFLEAAFARGIETGDMQALYRLAQTANLSEAEVDTALQDESWRAVAEANRADMLGQGLWGVPSFCVEGHALLWGQDRLWMLEQDLIDTVKGS
jgi:2-hydroxychromene-2-carboxylate isomerase